MMRRHTHLIMDPDPNTHPAQSRPSFKRGIGIMLKQPPGLESTKVFEVL